MNRTALSDRCAHRYIVKRSEMSFLLSAFRVNKKYAFAKKVTRNSLHHDKLMVVREIKNVKLYQSLWHNQEKSINTKHITNYPHVVWNIQECAQGRRILIINDYRTRFHLVFLYFYWVSYLDVSCHGQLYFFVVCFLCCICALVRKAICVLYG